MYKAEMWSWQQTGVCIICISSNNITQLALLALCGMPACVGLPDSPYLVGPPPALPCPQTSSTDCLLRGRTETTYCVIDCLCSALKQAGQLTWCFEPCHLMLGCCQASPLHCMPAEIHSTMPTAMIDKCIWTQTA